MAFRHPQFGFLRELFFQQFAVTMSAIRAAAVAANLLLLASLCALAVLADDITHVYDEGEAVKIYANKIGPFNNPLETYAYFELPGCRPASEEHKFPSLGQALAGDEHFEMAIRVKFGQPVEGETICSYTPTLDDVKRWTSMVDEQYWYQLLADDLPMWAVFGNHTPDGKRVIYTHQSFSFGRNGNRIVVANLTADKPVEPVAGTPIVFTYSAKFTGANVEFDRRFDRYLDDAFFEHKIHWFSIFNSFMIVLFLVGLVGAILTRTLRTEYAKISEERSYRELGSKDDWVEDSGWKQLHADVFRVPPHAIWLCAAVGTGAQLTALSLLVVTIAIASTVHTAPGGSLMTYAVLSWALTSVIAGYSSSSLFVQFASTGPNLGQRWMSCVLCTAALFPGTVLVAGFLLNFVAIAYDSAQAIPFGGMVAMLLLWALVSCPLVVIGTVVARHGSRAATMSQTAPPRINQIPRIIPPRPWYRSKLAFILGGGVLPFGSIFIELYLVFTSFWGYKLYYVYGFMLLVFFILLIVTSCVSVVCTYFLVSAEDHQWQWTSFALGASTAGYVFAYSVYFFWFKTRMTGFFMFAFYFTYMGLLCFGLALLCGTVGYLSSSSFIRRIYRNVKTD